MLALVACLPTLDAAKDANIVRSINSCLSRFTGEDMSLLESMMLKNFNDVGEASNTHTKKGA